MITTFAGKVIRLYNKQRAPLINRRFRVARASWSKFSEIFRGSLVKVACLHELGRLMLAIVLESFTVLLTGTKESDLQSPGQQDGSPSSSRVPQRNLSLAHLWTWPKMRSRSICYVFQEVWIWTMSNNSSVPHNSLLHRRMPWYFRRVVSGLTLLTSGSSLEPGAECCLAVNLEGVIKTTTLCLLDVFILHLDHEKCSDEL